MKSRVFTEDYLVPARRFHPLLRHCRTRAYPTVSEFLGLAAEETRSRKSPTDRIPCPRKATLSSACQYPTFASELPVVLTVLSGWVSMFSTGLVKVTTFVTFAD